VYCTSFLDKALNGAIVIASFLKALQLADALGIRGGICWYQPMSTGFLGEICRMPRATRHQSTVKFLRLQRCAVPWLCFDAGQWPAWRIRWLTAPEVLCLALWWFSAALVAFRCNYADSLIHLVPQDQGLQCLQLRSGSNQYSIVILVHRCTFQVRKRRGRLHAMHAIAMAWGLWLLQVHGLRSFQAQWLRETCVTPYWNLKGAVCCFEQLGITWAYLQAARKIPMSAYRSRFQPIVHRCS
jgi:hypothetical protein